MREGILKIDQAHKEDYNEILPLFIYPDEEAAKIIYPEMDRAIEKFSKVIANHSMRIQGKERNNWIADSYYLLGKSKFYKHDYVGADEAFQYATKAFQQDPIHWEAMLWVGINHLHHKKHTKADAVLSMINNEARYPTELRGYFHAVYADYYIQQKDYNSAIDHLEKAVKMTDDRTINARYSYVLAQLYQETRNFHDATQHFENVIEMKPKYELLFNAKISLAKAYDVRAKNAEEIKDELYKMLNDKKNYEYRDQIYFALAELYFRKGDQTEGISYYQKSVAVSSNSKHKTMVYKLLGDLFFKLPHYVNSKLYYDSTLLFMDKNHENYHEIQFKNEGLTKLVENIRIIELQDSLIGLSTMDERDIDKLIANLIKEAKVEDEQLRLKKEAFEQQELAQKNASRLKGPSSWYFTNSTTLEFGRKEFSRIWGERTLEDHWRRSDKQTLSFDLKEEVEPIEEPTEPEFVDERYTEEYYKKNLLTTAEAVGAAHNKVIAAHYECGEIYKETFEDEYNAIYSFEEIGNNYDTSAYALPSYYQLYRIYLRLEDHVQAEKYKAMILDNYPFSEFAKIIRDPQYAEKKNASKKNVEQFYETVYDLYTKELYAEVVQACETADTSFVDNHMSPKFSYLKALAIGRSDSKDEFKTALEAVVKTYPNDEVKIKAQDILNRMNGAEIKEQQAEEGFIDDPLKKHLFVVLIPLEDKNFSNYKSRISSFTSKYYNEKSYKVKNHLFKENFQLVNVGSLADAEAAMEFYDSFLNDKEIMPPLVEKNYTTFVISKDNYALLTKNENLNEYLEFFSLMYILNSPQK